MTGVECGPIGERDLARQGGALHNPGLLENGSFGIDDSRNTRIGAPGQRDSVLDTTETGHIKMLERSRGPAEPPIISDIDQEIGARGDRLPNKRRINNFIANRR